MSCCESRGFRRGTALHLIGVRLPPCSAMRAIMSLLLLFATMGYASEEVPVVRPKWGEPYCIPDAVTGFTTCIVLPDGVALDNDRPDIKRKTERAKFLDANYYSQNLNQQRK